MRVLGDAQTEGAGRRWAHERSCETARKDRRAGGSAGGGKAEGAVVVGVELEVVVVLIDCGLVDVTMSRGVLQVSSVQHCTSYYSSSCGRCDARRRWKGQGTGQMHLHCRRADQRHAAAARQQNRAGQGRASQVVTRTLVSRA